MIAGIMFFLLFFFYIKWSLLKSSQNVVGFVMFYWFFMLIISVLVSLFYLSMITIIGSSLVSNIVLSYLAPCIIGIVLNYLFCVAIYYIFYRYFHNKVTLRLDRQIRDHILKTSVVLGFFSFWTLNLFIEGWTANNVGAIYITIIISAIFYIAFRGVFKVLSSFLSTLLFGYLPEVDLCEGSLGHKHATQYREAEYVESTNSKLHQGNRGDRRIPGPH